MSPPFHETSYDSTIMRMRMRIIVPLQGVYLVHPAVISNAHSLLAQGTSAPAGGPVTVRPGSLCRDP